jgi:hypothetical protein
MNMNSLFLMYRLNQAESAIFMYFLWLILLMDHLVSRYLYFTTAGVKCRVAAVKHCPVLHPSVFIFFWSFGLIDASAIKCWKLSTAQVYKWPTILQVFPLWCFISVFQKFKDNISTQITYSSFCSQINNTNKT